MKILYVTTISNTINAFLIPHIKMLIEKGHKVDVAYKVEQESSPKISKIGCYIYELEFSRSLLKNNYLKLIKQIKSLVINNGYDIIHTHTPIASVIVRIACRNLDNVNVIYTAHGFHFYNGAPLINWVMFYPIEKILSKYTDTLITINQEDFKRAQTFKAKRIEYVGGVGIDLKNIQINKEHTYEVKESEGITPADFVLCSIGELNYNKNHKVVLEALRKINKKNIRYLVIGVGKLKEELIQKTKELKLEDQVSFLGYREDIFELLELSDVFVFPSYREGLSKSLMEAMAMGKPIIASDIRGNRDLIDNRAGGFLFNPKNANQLSEYIVEMMNNCSLRKTAGTYNMEKVKQFSLENILNEMSNKY